MRPQPSDTPQNDSEALSSLLRGLDRAGSLKQIVTLPGKTTSLEKFPDQLALPLIEVLKKQGINALYSHQVLALNQAFDKKNWILNTPTASGKSLCFWLPVLQGLLEDPKRRCIALFPTKALAQDQFQKLNELIDSSADLMSVCRPLLYDGDTKKMSKAETRRDTNILFTNPDMLHCSILPKHGRWGEFFANCKYIVVDEAHVYRGIFGSHVSLLFSRMRRLCERFGSDLQWFLASATIGNPQQLGQLLISQSIQCIQSSELQMAEKLYAIWDPTEIGKEGIYRGSMYQHAQELLQGMGTSGLRCLAFTQSRLQCELLAKYLKEKISRRFSITDPVSSHFVESYRGGYTPKERRLIEQRISRGETRIVISTSALELGIDIGDLQVVLCFGFPGSLSTFRQRAGRAGRRMKQSVVILLSSSAPLDQYINRHPEYLWQGHAEDVVLDPNNPSIMRIHLLCAAFELPLAHSDARFFGPGFQTVLQSLLAESKLKQLDEKWYLPKGETPALQYGLRSLSEERYRITNVEDVENTLSELESNPQRRGLFPGAIYLHQGENYEVVALDSERKQILVKQSQANYFTVPRFVGNTFWTDETESKTLDHFNVISGSLRQQSLLTRLKCVEFHSNSVQGYIPVQYSMPDLNTLGIGFYPNPGLQEKFIREGSNYLAGLAGLLHLLEAALPMVALLEKEDLQASIDCNRPEAFGIVFFENYEGGMGLVQKLFQLVQAWLKYARTLLFDCPCENGCPACVGLDLLDFAGNEKIVAEKTATKLLFQAF